jgi:hypothetical protein
MSVGQLASRDATRKWRAAHPEQWKATQQATYRRNREKQIARAKTRQRQMVEAVAALADREDELSGMAEILFGGVA